MEESLDGVFDGPHTPRRGYSADSVEYRSDGKHFNDPIHGTFSLKNITCAVVDGKAVQRLRKLKQLGFCYFVYPGASHNRFEHSLGVAHLAGTWAEYLMQIEREPHEEIDRCATLLELAGICHDLGHGPFSHTWEATILPSLGVSNWHHEHMSEQLMDYIFDTQSIMDNFQLTRSDVDIVKKLISGEKPGMAFAEGSDIPLYLFDIVNNRTNGIDVDKLDYLQRDSNHAGVSISASYDRILKFAKPGDKQIRFRLHERENLSKVFQDRFNLHRVIYKHKTVRAIELMVGDALYAVGHELQLAERSQNIEQFLTLSDTLLDYIQNHLSSTTLGTITAKQILERIESRDLYRLCGQMKIPTDAIPLFKGGIDPQHITTHQSVQTDVDLRPGDIAIDTVYTDKGMKSRDPLHSVEFYKERRMERCDSSESFGETESLSIRVYSKHAHHEQALKEAFERYQQSFRFNPHVLTPPPCETKPINDEVMSD